jgi:hypothetical protein
MKHITYLGPSYRNDYCPKKIPFGKFFNNSVHSVGRFGVWVFPGYNPTISGNCNDNRLSVAKFENLYTYGSDMGVQYVQSCPLQFKNLIAFDHVSTAIEAQTISFSENLNTQTRNLFYNETIGPGIFDSVIIGNSDSSSSYSISETGIRVLNITYYKKQNCLFLIILRWLGTEVC